MLRLYFKYVAVAIVLCFLVGFLLPWLLSAKSTLAVWFGIAIIICVPVIIYKNREGIKDDIQAVEDHFKEK